MRETINHAGAPKQVRFIAYPEEGVKRVGQELLGQFMISGADIEAGLAQLGNDTSITTNDRFASYLSAVKTKYNDVRHLVDGMATTGRVAVMADDINRELILLEENTPVPV